MGNICRSPAAENVMRHLLKREGLEGSWEVDSAGMTGLHTGSAPDARMTRAARKRRIEMRGSARQVKRSDLEDFDLILAMDRENLADLRALRPEAGRGEKVRLFCDFCEVSTEKEVPDPYYGGEAGFELVMDLLEDGCGGLLRKWKAGELRDLA